MKFDDMEPPRFEDKGPEALRNLVRAHRGEPSREAIERVTERFAAARASGALASSVAGARAFARVKLGIFALAAAGGLLLAWRTIRSETTASAPETAPVVATPHAGPSEHEPAPPSPAQVLAQVQAPATISVDQLPSAPPNPAHVPSAKMGAEAKTAPSAESEFDIVQRAQAALATDPSRALAVTGEHLRAYPSGELVQEREVVAVEALVKMGRRDDASRRARALTERFPNTPYATRLEKALGHSCT